MSKLDILIDSFIPYKSLSESEIDLIVENSYIKKFDKNQQITETLNECLGLIILKKGQLKVYSINEDGREITLYRLLEGDSCILSASCMLKDINFSINLHFEKDTELLIIPANIYEEIKNSNTAVNNYTLNLVSSRFSDVMWTLQKYVFEGVATRLAQKIIEISNLSESNIISITHEDLGKEIGTMREVVSRLLKKFEGDNLIKLSRGKIEIVEKNKLLKV